jgi:hypothetical protein
MAAWDGSGVDPWLPDRLARDARIAEAERNVFRQLWADLSSWLVSVRRAVLGGDGGEVRRPDPDSVWAFVPDWLAIVDALVTGPILDAFGLAFRTIFGDGYRFDNRAAAAAHLGSVRNRMVRTPDEVFNLVATAIAEGAGLGEDIRKLRDRVRRILSVTETEMWPNRAVTVARTETLGALNAGRQDAFAAVAAELGGDFERMWLATADTRTRPSHRDADGQRQPIGTPYIIGADPDNGAEGAQLMFPGDPTGPAHEVIQCRCTQLLLRPGEDIDLSDRHYSTW